MAKKAKVPNCMLYKKCGRKAQGPRAKFCESCFRANAARAGRRSSGNSQGNPDNAGNSQAQGNPDNAGNAHAQGNPGNDGNAQGNPNNAGNTRKGVVKKRAGKRSGVRRSAKRALVVKKKWLDLILAGQKNGKSAAARQQNVVGFTSPRARLAAD